MIFRSETRALPIWSSVMNPSFSGSARLLLGSASTPSPAPFRHPYLWSTILTNLSIIPHEVWFMIMSWFWVEVLKKHRLYLEKTLSYLLPCTEIIVWCYCSPEFLEFYSIQRSPDSLCDLRIGLKGSPYIPSRGHRIHSSSNRRETRCTPGSVLYSRNNPNPNGRHYR